MILHNDKHLHVDEQDPIADWLFRSMKSAQRGTINVDIGSQSAVKIDMNIGGSCSCTSMMVLPHSAHWLCCLPILVIYHSLLPVKVSEDLQR